MELSERDNSFALAIAVLRERVRQLPTDDQNDLYELLPALLGDDLEERASAQQAVKEILDQVSGKMHRVKLPEAPSEALQQWTTFVSGRIQQARQEAGLTQDQLAMKSGLTQSHICKLEHGLHSPTAMTLKKIADALQRPVSYFDPRA